MLVHPPMRVSRSDMGKSSVMLAGSTPRGTQTRMSTGARRQPTASALSYPHPRPISLSVACNSPIRPIALSSPCSLRAPQLGYLRQVPSTPPPTPLHYPPLLHPSPDRFPPIYHHLRHLYISPSAYRTILNVPSLPRLPAAPPPPPSPPPSARPAAPCTTCKRPLLTPRSATARPSRRCLPSPSRPTRI